MLDAIPTELRQLRQWVSAGPDKEPINSRTGQRASVDDSETWSTFDEARQSGYMHVGFVLSKSDPYAIIDLDQPVSEEQRQRHVRILQAFDTTYAELSQSGNGVHIVLRGQVEKGRKRDKVEVYSDGRYMIFTGRAMNQRPIVELQPTLDMLIEHMPTTLTTALSEQEAVIDDAALWDMAGKAVNSDKFKRLWSGDFADYASQSEADFALLSILAFYTRSNEQVRRIFRMSALGQREKATRNDDYINRALEKIRGRQQVVPLIDLSALDKQQMILPGMFNPEESKLVVVTPPSPPPAPSIVLPPGLIGEMCNYIYSSAIRPVWEISLAAAIGLGAGIAGRHFNVSSTGLNQYVITIAGTGTGKEGAHNGIDALLASIRPQMPGVDQFIGPGTFASGQALVRVLDRKPCFVSILGEVGLMLQQICAPNAGAHLLQLRRTLLDVYAKSGWNKLLHPSVYSDSEKNTQTVRAPNVTILGESTPTTFYGALEGHHISEGLVPRFMVIEYTGPRVPINTHAFHAPDAGLSTRLGALVQTVLSMQSNNSCCPVLIDKSADGELSVFNTFADDMINSATDDVTKQLWNRGHLKALKLSALVAVGCNVNQPCVTREIAEWAISLVRRDITNMASKFSSGEVGHGDHELEAEVIKACDRYQSLPESTRKQYKVPNGLINRGNLIPYIFLKQYLKLRSAYKNDRRGAVTALQFTLKDMVTSGQLSQIPLPQAKSELGVDSPVYYRGESWQ